MKLYVGNIGLVLIMTLIGSAFAQNAQLSEPIPDQPVQPQVPTLVPRTPPAQSQPAAPFTLTPQEEAQVDRILNLWEQRNSNIKTFDCRFKRWIYDVVFGSPNVPKSIELGTIRYAAPDKGSFCVEAMEKDGREVPIEPDRAERWICDGKSVFNYNVAKKQLIEHRLPPELQGKAIADSPLPFLFGAQAKKLKQRYWIRIVPPPPGVHDQIELEAWPRYQQDKANFDHANFIITAQKMEPYALKIVETNQKDYRVYQFYDIVINDPLRLFKGDPFRAVTPLGWQKIVEDPPTSQARSPGNNNTPH